MKHKIYLQLLSLYLGKYKANFDRKSYSIFLFKNNKKNYFSRKIDKKNAISIYILVANLLNIENALFVSIYLLAISNFFSSGIVFF